ncbi:MAG: hypothetical protein MZU91_14870 [Desulfosudis oleivorans]|nr:hypothetical protein [Desulfosudis oleivorans]
MKRSSGISDPPWVHRSEAKTVRSMPLTSGARCSLGGVWVSDEQTCGRVERHRPRRHWVTRTTARVACVHAFRP